MWCEGGVDVTVPRTRRRSWRCTSCFVFSISNEPGGNFGAIAFSAKTQVVKLQSGAPDPQDGSPTGEEH